MAKKTIETITVETLQEKINEILDEPCWKLKQGKLTMEKNE